MNCKMNVSRGPDFLKLDDNSIIGKVRKGFSNTSRNPLLRRVS